MRGTIIGGGSFIQDGEQKYVLTLVALDGTGVDGVAVAANKTPVRLIFTTFLPHAIAIDPNHAGRAAVFEKHGPGACYVDLLRGEVLTPITTASSRHFYGHGAYSVDGNRLYATESLLDDAFRGALVIRDAKTLQQLGTMPTFGTAPHDCILLDDGTTMVVTNGGGPLRGGAAPNICYIDIPSETLLEEVKLKAPRFNAGHIAITPRGDLAMVSAPRTGLPNKSRSLGAVSLKPKGQPLVTMSKPKKVVQRMKGETLSVLIQQPQQRVLATHPEGDMITMWSLSEGKLLRKYDDFSQPRGICTTLDGQLWVVGHSLGTGVALSFIDASSGAVLPHKRIYPSYISGSHIFAHQLPPSPSATASPQ